MTCQLAFISSLQIAHVSEPRGPDESDPPPSIRLDPLVPLNLRRTLVCFLLYYFFFFSPNMDVSKDGASRDVTKRHQWTNHRV